jgi:hypothetical protein
MNRPVGLCAVLPLVVACLSVGCSPTRALVPTTVRSATEQSKSKPNPIDNKSGSIGRPSGDGTITPAGGGKPPGEYPIGAAGGPPGPAGATPAAPQLPQPKELPIGTGLTIPPPAGPSGPHVRATPTATGEMLNLAPGEQAIDRVVELSRQLVAAENNRQALQARIRELEANGQSREQAVAEMVREVETASAEIAATQVTLRALRTELEALKARLKQTEDEDVELLTDLVALLDKLLKPPASRAPGGKQVP